MYARNLKTDELQHYGVKGMKWRHRKGRQETRDKDDKAKRLYIDKYKKKQAEYYQGRTYQNSALAEARMATEKERYIQEQNYFNSSDYLKKKGEKMARKYQDMPLPKRSGK